MQSPPNPQPEPLYQRDRVTIGRVWGDTQPVRLNTNDLSRHLLILGQTGTGKSTLLANVLLQQIYQGEGVGLIDPHGDLCRQVLDQVPRSRSDDTIYIDAADETFAIAVDWFGRQIDPLKRPLVAQSIVGAMKGRWRDSWGPRMEFILHASLLALLECPNTSLLGLPRLLSDPRYRDWVIQQVSDPAVRHFFQNEMERWDKRQHAEFVSPIQNKVGQLFLSPHLRGLFGQATARLNLRNAMDRRQVLLVNLNKGSLGEENADLLGSMLLAMIEAAAMSRADVPENDRVRFTLVVDEFASVSTDRFARALSESRKYRLGLVLAGQFMDQLAPDVRSALIGNVGTMICLRVGTTDAELLARHVGGSNFRADALTELANHTAIVRRFAAVDDPFRIDLLPPIQTGLRHGDHHRDQSRKRFGTPRGQVEDRIRRWMAN